MTKIIQFGEGNFLRTFVDLYFDTLNKENLGSYEVNIIKPIAFGNLEKFVKQNNKYNVVLRGFMNGETVENVYHIDSISNAIDPFTNFEKYISLAKDPELKILVSNTTEAGICFNASDDRNAFNGATYPAKLTNFLFERFRANLPGIYLLPVELIENNADELYRCVNEYITLWNLGEDFRKWNNEQCYYCNTLVDRIVSGFPRDSKVKEHLDKLIGYEDQLVSIGEPFGLWVIQNKGELSKYIKDGHHNIDIILTDDISYYKKRKVRILNGSHTNLVPISLWLGKETVYDVMADDKLSNFVNSSLKNEIIPFVSTNIEASTEFANSVKERFMNPFLNHLLISISLNSISKWKARVLPTFVDYYNKNKKIPSNLTIGFAYLANIYMHLEENNGAYICHLPNRNVEYKDDLCYLTYFKTHSLSDFISDNSIWGLNLSTFEGFEETVKMYLDKINKGIDLI